MYDGKKWISKPDLPLPARMEAASCYYPSSGSGNGSIIIAGGMIGDPIDIWVPTSLVHRFDLHENKWYPFASLPDSRSTSQLLVIHGVMYCMGGHLSRAHESYVVCMVFLSSRFMSSCQLNGM
jgi:hypothetical protein